jgi:hypothetical protein
MHQDGMPQLSAFILYCLLTRALGVDPVNFAVDPDTTESEY